MKNILLSGFMLLFFLASAQKAVPEKITQKPVLLKAQAKTQTIGMEYKDDILYFAKPDILALVEGMAMVDKHPIYAQTIQYLNAAPNEMVFKKKDSIKFNNLGERNLYKVLIEVDPEMRANGMVAIMNKKTKQFNTPKTKIQTISMEYSTETLYFSKADLISILNNKSQNDRIHIYNPVINYLNTTDKPVLLKYNDTIGLVGAGERNLHKIILEVAPQLLANAKAADKVKKTGAFNKQIFVESCENNKEKKIIIEKKEGSFLDANKYRL